VQSRLGNWDEAIDTCRNLLANDNPGPGRTAKWLWMIAYFSEEKGEIDNAMAAYQDVALRYPGHECAGQACLRLARQLNREGLGTEAAALLKSGMEEEWASKYPLLKQSALEQQALIYADMRNHDAAIQICFNLVSDNTNSLETAKWLWMVGFFQRLKGDIVGGRFTFQDVIARYPGSKYAGEACMQMSICLAGEDKAEQGLMAMHECQAENADQFAQALLLRGQYTAFYAKDYTGAVSILNQFLITYPADPRTEEAKTALVDSLVNCGRVGDAVNLVMSSVPECASEDLKVHALSEVGFLYFNGKHYRQAIDTLEPLLPRLSSERRERAKYEIGLSYWLLCDAARARQEMSELCAQCPDTNYGQNARHTLAGWEHSLPPCPSDESGIP